MPLIDITNPDVIKFLVESYDKTARLRMNWINRYGERLKEAATIKGKEKGYRESDVLKATMKAGMATITRDHISGARNRKLPHIHDTIRITGVADLKKGHSIVDINLGDPVKDSRLARPDSDLSPDPIMRPVDPNQKEIIYKGIPNYGRLAYLKSRSKEKPEDKYYISQVTGWDHGWKLGESFFGRAAPEHGRVWRLTHDLKGRSGPHPDPPHYASPETNALLKCSI